MRRAIYRLEQKAELGFERRDQPLLDRSGPRVRRSKIALRTLDQVLAQRPEDLLLAFEAEIHRALGDLGFARDVVDRGAPVAVLTEQLERRLEYCRAFGFRRTSSWSVHAVGSISASRRQLQLPLRPYHHLEHIQFDRLRHRKQHR